MVAVAVFPDTLIWTGCDCAEASGAHTSNNRVEAITAIVRIMLCP